MSTMSNHRLKAWAIAAALTFAPQVVVGATPRLPVFDGIGGEFSAPSSLDREISLSEYRGRVVLVFFGYTTCQDICPATLAHLKSLFNRLGPDADRVQVLLVTVDPATDTPEHLKQYLARFDSRFVGVTGDADQLGHIAQLFGVKSAREHGVEMSTEYNRAKTFTDRSYLYSHSQQIFLLDTVGRARAQYFVGSPVEEMKADVLSLLKESSPTETIDESRREH